MTFIASVLNTMATTLNRLGFPKLGRFEMLVANINSLDRRRLKRAIQSTSQNRCVADSYVLLIWDAWRDALTRLVPSSEQYLAYGEAGRFFYWLDEKDVGVDWSFFVRFAHYVVKTLGVSDVQLVLECCAASASQWTYQDRTELRKIWLGSRLLNGRLIVGEKKSCAWLSRRIYITSASCKSASHISLSADDPGLLFRLIGTNDSLGVPC